MKTTSSLKPLLFALVALTMLSVSIRSDWLGKYLSSVHEQNLRQDQPRVSELTSAARRLAGPNATFCNGGHFYDKRRMPSADACAVAAFKARKPFRLLYQRGNGRDGYDEAELVVTPGGAGFCCRATFTQILVIIPL
jgi:hypothetical protein